MVGSVLLDRMRDEGDFAGIEVHFFSTSNPGGAAPEGGANARLRDARDIRSLAGCDVVLSCQGGGYTTEVFGELRATGWDGYWLDAASTLRLRGDATLVLDPVNGDLIRERLAGGCRTFVGANCTVSLLLMAIGGLIRAGWVDWVSTMTYQAISGAGARRLAELARQVRHLGECGARLRGASSVEIGAALTDAQRDESFPTEEIGAPLACSVLPWIDRAVENGQTREEWKAGVEAGRILGASAPLKIDGICCRIDALRCHAQALCIRLNRDIPLPEVESALLSGNDWVRLVENTQAATLRELTPAMVANTLEVRVGRLRRLSMGRRYVGAFTVGDQLLWGAAEPLRRMLSILREAA